MSDQTAGRFAIGVDVGGTKILAVALDVDRPTEPLAVRRVPTPATADEIAATVAGLVADLVASAGPHRVLAGVGIGLPGLVDRRGILRYGPNVAGVEELDVNTAVRAATGLVPIVDNDATLAAWAEVRVGAARGESTVVAVTLGTGIGGGLVVDGRRLRGHEGFAGEVGHMVIDLGGPRCACGRQGCWEALASGTALSRMVSLAVARGELRSAPTLAGRLDAGDGAHLGRALDAGDEGAVRLLADYARFVAIGIVNLQNLLDPDVVVIGGGVSEIGAPLIDAIRKHVDGAVLGASHRSSLRIVAAALGAEANAIGGALLAFDEAPT